MPAVWAFVARLATWFNRLLIPLWVNSKYFNNATGNLIAGMGVGIVNTLGLQWLFGDDADEESISQQIVGAFYALGAVLVVVIGFLGWKQLRKTIK